MVIMFVSDNGNKVSGSNASFVDQLLGPLDLDRLALTKDNLGGIRGAVHVDWPLHSFT